MAKGFVLIFVFLCIPGSLLFSQEDEPGIIATASSTLPSSRTSDFDPMNLFDETIMSWSEGAEGDGIDEYIEIELNRPVHLQYVMIKNGYGSDKYWDSNNRVKTLSVRNEKGEERLLSLSDTDSLRLYGLYKIVEDEYGSFYPEGSLIGRTFRFTIKDVYKGSKWQDACIAELGLNRWYYSDLAMDRDYIIRALYMDFLDGVVDSAGTLMFESDWEGFFPAEITDGHYYEEIVAGDATTGYDDYQVFINDRTGDYYMFWSGYVKEEDYPYMEGSDGSEEEVDWIESFLWDFYRYDILERQFHESGMDAINELFIVNPLAELERRSARELSPEDIWVQCDGPDVLVFTIIDPEGEESEVKLEYLWDGNWFRIQ